MNKVNVTVWGYGGEIVVDKITEEQFDYWNENDDLQHYCLSPDEYDVPEEANFVEESWWEKDSEGHYWGCTTGCQITIDVNGEQFFDGYLTDFSDMVMEKNEEAMVYVDDHVLIDEDTLGDGYYFMVLSEEKGTFFNGSIEIDEEFDPAKLEFLFATVLGGEFLHDVSYDGESIDNSNGGDTNGKSFRAEVFEV